MWNNDNDICDYCKSQEFPMEQCNHVRTGKTKKEREDGTSNARFDNRRERMAWQQDRNADNRTFPTGTCNGRKNRK